MGCSGDYEAVLTLAAPNPKLFRQYAQVQSPFPNKKMKFEFQHVDPCFPCSGR